MPIPRFLAEELAVHVADKLPGDFVFAAEKGGVLHLRNFRRMTSTPPSARRPGRAHPAALRHTAASLAIASGANVKVVQTMLGHQSATMTLDLYGHLLNDQLDEVAGPMDAARAAEASARRPAATVAALPTGRSAGGPVRMTRPAGSRVAVDGPFPPPSGMPAVLVAGRALASLRDGPRPPLPACAGRRGGGLWDTARSVGRHRGPREGSAPGRRAGQDTPRSWTPAAPSRRAVDDERAVGHFGDEALRRHRDRPLSLPGHVHPLHDRLRPAAPAGGDGRSRAVASA